MKSLIKSVVPQNGYEYVNIGQVRYITVYESKGKFCITFFFAENQSLTWSFVDNDSREAHLNLIDSLSEVPSSGKYSFGK